MNGLPVTGNPIFVSAQPHLKARGGQLLSGPHQLGTPVHAASFIRRRMIVLETQLLSRPRMLKRIVVHELFHFVWARLGNAKRAAFHALIEAEIQARARGELGESSQGWKEGIVAGGDFKNYVCESFCDTAAWLYSGAPLGQGHKLALRWRQRRSRWFAEAFNGVYPC